MDDQSTSPEDVASRFVSAINKQDVELIVSMLTEDHRFVNSVGEALSGHAQLRQAWSKYFAMVTEYHIEISETFARGQVVVLIGEAGGTYAKEGRWQTPAVWRAVVSEDKLSEWRVYADNEPLRILIRNAYEG